MANKLTNFAELEIINHILGETQETYTRPDHLYLALCTADPGESASGGTLDEPSAGNGYARTLCDSWNTAANRAIENSEVIEFSEATGNWGEITHFALLDTITLATGHVIAYGELSQSKKIGSGDSASVVIEDLELSFNSGGISTFLANEMLDHVFKGDAYAQPASIFVALATTAITDDTTGSTISEPGSNYTRRETNDWSAAANGATENESDIEFAQAAAAWGTVGYFAICDHPTTGHILFYGTLTTIREIGSGDTARFPAGALNITMD